MSSRGRSFKLELDLGSDTTSWFERRAGVNTGYVRRANALRKASNSKRLSIEKVSWTAIKFRVHVYKSVRVPDGTLNWASDDHETIDFESPK